jgi:type IV pilus biogenesis protein CpaD/CtpE
MKLLLTAFTLATVVITSSAARAEWIYSDAQDELDDSERALVGAFAEETTSNTAYMMQFQCWKGQPEQTMLVLATTEKQLFENQLDAQEFAIRVDKNPVRKMVLAPSPSDDDVIRYVTAARVEEAMPALLDEVEHANKKVIVTFGSELVHFTVKGAAKTLAKLREHCAFGLGAGQ